jgi:hypothetical protein
LNTVLRANVRESLKSDPGTERGEGHSAYMGLDMVAREGGEGVDDESLASRCAAEDPPLQGPFCSGRAAKWGA